jgi:2-C-methyl-D-erythritol 4-phosphate cytidylyltransferase
MTKEELIEFLKENLSISVDVEGSSYTSKVTVSVDLWLGKEIIASDSAYGYME